MREILFRGKRIDNGEWIEGYYAAEPYVKSTYNYGYILENEKDLFAKNAYGRGERVMASCNDCIHIVFFKGNCANDVVKG